MLNIVSCSRGRVLAIGQRPQAEFAGTQKRFSQILEDHGIVPEAGNSWHGGAERTGALGGKADLLDVGADRQVVDPQLPSAGEVRHDVVR
jgi:hypothetical protein